MDYEKNIPENAACKKTNEIRALVLLAFSGARVERGRSVEAIGRDSAQPRGMPMVR